MLMLVSCVGSRKFAGYRHRGKAQMLLSSQKSLSDVDGPRDCHTE